MAFFGYLSKLRRGLGLVFGAQFLHDFFIKMFLIYFSINGKSFNVTPYFFLKISNKVYYEVLIYTADDVMNFKIFLGSSSKAMADGKKRREDENTKI